MYEYRMIALNNYIEKICSEKKQLNYMELITTFKNDVSSYELIEILCSLINAYNLIDNKRDIRELSELIDKNEVLQKKYDIIADSWNKAIRKNTRLQNQIISLKREKLESDEKINTLELRLKTAVRDLEGLRNLNKSKI